LTIIIEGSLCHYQHYGRYDLDIKYVVILHHTLVSSEQGEDIYLTLY